MTRYPASPTRAPAAAAPINKIQTKTFFRGPSKTAGTGGRGGRCGVWGVAAVLGGWLGRTRRWRADRGQCCLVAAATARSGTPPPRHSFVPRPLSYVAAAAAVTSPTREGTLPPVRPSVRSSAPPPAVLLIKVFFFSPGRRLSLCVLLFAGERTNERAERMCVCVCGGQGVKEGYRRGRRAEGGNEIIRRFDEVRRLLLTDSRRIC